MEIDGQARDVVDDLITQVRRIRGLGQGGDGQTRGEKIELEGGFFAENIPPDHEGGDDVFQRGASGGREGFKYGLLEC